MAAFIDTVNLLVSPLPLHKRDIERIVGRVRHNFEISRKRRKKGRKERKPEIFRNFRKSRTLDDIPRRVVKSERAENPDLFPVVASLSSSRNFLHPPLPPWPLLSSSRSALLTLYTSICYAVALCATDRRDPAGVLADLSLTLSSPPRLYLASIIKINRPISYVKYYPRARLNILSLSTLPLPLLLPSPPPVSKGERGGGQKAAEGDRSRERHAIRFCFVARSSSSSSPLVSGFRAKGEGREKQGDIVAVKRLRDLSLYRRVGKRGTIAAIVSSIRPWNRWNLCSIDERESKEARFLPICHVASRLVFSARIERERGAGQQRGLLLI